MSTAARPTPPRPAYAPLQSSASSSQDSTTFQSYTMGSPPPVPQAPVVSPAGARAPQDIFAAQQQQQQQAQEAQLQPQMPAMQRYRSFEYQPDRGDAGRTACETTSYLNQAALLAEAAKRAQVAVVMRDFDSMEL